MLPSGLRSRGASVETLDGPLDEALPEQSVTIRLEDDVDPAAVACASRRPGEPWFLFEQPDRGHDKHQDSAFWRHERSLSAPQTSKPPIAKCDKSATVPVPINADRRSLDN